jgi:hypothetical protein
MSQWQKAFWVALGMKVARVFSLSLFQFVWLWHSCACLGWSYLGRTDSFKVCVCWIYFVMVLVNFVTDYFTELWLLSASLKLYNLLLSYSLNTVTTTNKWLLWLTTYNLLPLVWKVIFISWLDYHRIVFFRERFTRMILTLLSLPWYVALSFPTKHRRVLFFL